MEPQDSKINRYRDEINKAEQIIKEFQYRQVITLTKFEHICSKKDTKIRDEVVSTLQNEADEMIEHGYYSHYHYRAKETLKKLLKQSDTEIQAVMLSYYLLPKKEREKLKRHIIAGVVEERPEKYTLKANPEYKKCSTVVLGESIVKGYRMLMLKKGLFNIPYQLSNRSYSEKNEIKNILFYSVKLVEEKGMNIAVKSLTQSLVPYYFKEARPYIGIGKNIPALVSSYARPEKYANITKLLTVFSWLFLTEQDPLDRQRIIENLYPNSKQRDLRNLIRKQNFSLCHC